MKNIKIINFRRAKKIRRGGKNRAHLAPRVVHNGGQNITVARPIPRHVPAVRTCRASKSMVWEVREASQTAKTQSPARTSLDPGDLVVHLLDGAVRQLHLHPGDVTVHLLDEDRVVLLHLHDHGDVLVLFHRWHNLFAAY